MSRYKGTYQKRYGGTLMQAQAQLRNHALSHFPWRCKTGLVGAAGECEACGADQGVGCRAPRADGGANIVMKHTDIRS